MGPGGLLDSRGFQLDGTISNVRNNVKRTYRKNVADGSDVCGAATGLRVPDALILSAVDGEHLVYMRSLDAIQRGGDRVTERASSRRRVAAVLSHLYDTSPTFVSATFLTSPSRFGMSDDLARAVDVIISHMDGASPETRQLLTRIVSEIASLSGEQTRADAPQSDPMKALDPQQPHSPEHLAKSLKDLEEKARLGSVGRSGS